MKKKGGGRLEEESGCVFPIILKGQSTQNMQREAEADPWKSGGPHGCYK